MWLKLEIENTLENYFPQTIEHYFIMIHKFDKMPADINTRRNVFVLIDEAHRTTSSDLGSIYVGSIT
jgi:type I site-specific restriction-modification system R (restriction) subunit